MTTLIFRDFTFSARHHIPSKFGAAAIPHSHNYRVRMWFEAIHDQDELALWISKTFAKLSDSNLNAIGIVDSTDEALAATILAHGAERKCVRVRVTNDHYRGAEVCA